MWSGREESEPFAVDEDDGSCSWEAEQLLLGVGKVEPVHWVELEDVVERAEQLHRGESFRPEQRLVVDDVAAASVVEERLDWVLLAFVRVVVAVVEA